MIRTYRSPERQEAINREYQRIERVVAAKLMARQRRDQFWRKVTAFSMILGVMSAATILLDLLLGASQ